MVVDPHVEIRRMGSILLLCALLLDVGRTSNGPDLFLQLDPKAIVAPPPDIFRSPEFGKIYKCSKVLALEPSPTNPTTWVLTYASPLELLILNQLAPAHSLR
jgi:hypothetical protein